jgi:CTP:molybdopterin cytidylyltransferase MocA
LLGELMNLKDNQTVRDIVHNHSDKLVTVEAPEWSIIDIDTPEDYARTLSKYCSK